MARPRLSRVRVSRSVSLHPEVWRVVSKHAFNMSMSASSALADIVREWHKTTFGRPVDGEPTAAPAPAPASVEMQPEDREAFRIAQAAAMKAGLPGINTSEPIKHEHIEWEDDDDS